MYRPSRPPPNLAASRKTRGPEMGDPQMEKDVLWEMVLFNLSFLFSTKTSTKEHGTASYETASTLAPWTSLEVGVATMHSLAHQLPRVAGSMPGLEPSQEVLMRQARAGPHGQHCDRCIHQPTRWSTLPSHVATCPPPPPLESEVSEIISCHSRQMVLLSLRRPLQMSDQSYAVLSAAGVVANALSLLP